MNKKSRAPGVALRDEFLLDPDVIFLNHGSYGACPRPLFERYQAWQRELERQPVAFLGRRYETLMRAAREGVAPALGASADDLVFVPNATTGLNTVIRALPLEAGDEVLGTDHEYGALDRAWRFVCRRRGAHYRRHPIPLPVRSEEEIVDALWAAVTPRTRVLFLSHITSPTALTLPVAPLIRRARAAGILTVVDGAHVPGQRPLDLDGLGADFYSGNLHKWALAPKGCAFLHARQEVQSLLSPLVVSWGWEREVPGPSRFVDEQEYQGTRDIAAYLTAPAAIDFLATHDWPRRRADCHALVREARSRIGALTGLPQIAPDEPRWFAQMAAVPLPPCDPDTLKRRLYDEYRIEVPIIQWKDHLLIRVSIQVYNRRADVDALVDALAVLLPELTQTR